MRFPTTARRMMQAAFLFFIVTTARAQTPAPTTLVLTVEGHVDALRQGAGEWIPAKTNQVLLVRDRLRTAIKSRATVRLSDESILRLNQLTTIEVQPVPTGKKSVIDLKSGATYFYNREKPGDTLFTTPVASGAVRGTEFHLAVAEDGGTVLTLLDGQVDLTNQFGGIQLNSGEQGVVEPGKAPRKTASIDTINIIQWTLYYPAVLDLSELPRGSNANLEAALKSYQAGDLLKALEAYPTNLSAASSAQQIFEAALLLSVGQVDDAHAALQKITTSDQVERRLARSLESLIATVKHTAPVRFEQPTLASEWMAQSYADQAEYHLDRALLDAQNAARVSPSFGFAWERVAELEFSFGHTEKALAALDRALSLSPRNAQALALRGYLLAAQNRIDAAQNSFDAAIAIDPALGNAWLGRGLCQIRKGNAHDGRRDLQTAAVLEPNRAVFRSYIGKALSNEENNRLARKELNLSKKLDPNDPTSWLYIALLDQQENRINEAIRDLERSRDLNENRRVYRSSFLLDQDRAVRGANLAALYRDAGMIEVSVREASRSVNYDYGNYSTHLFLAESYDALRDPRLTNLRYETPWLNELLLANLLGPVGAGALSQNISQQEYSRLFEKDHLGISSLTEYFSSGDINERASQFGTYHDFSYSLDLEYRTENGQRPNNDLRFTTLWGKFKFQLAPRDSLFLQLYYQDLSFGDLAQYYDQNSASRTQRVKEKQEPFIFAGYHHEWSPGVHTLLFASRFDDSLTRTDPAFLQSVVKVAPSFRRDIYQFDLGYRTDLIGYSVEAQQIFQQHRNTLIAGGRFQMADSSTFAELRRPPTIFLPRFNDPPSLQRNETDLERISVYAYDYFQLAETFQLVGGVSYDRLIFPLNIDDPPISSAEKIKDQVSPKAGFIWTLATNSHLRGYYTRSLGGAFFDSSLRLEPSQVAGFNQAYRSFIPESISGLVPGSRFHNYGVAFDHEFPNRTYFGIEGELLRSTAERAQGAFNYIGLGLSPALPGVNLEQLNYEEKSLYVTFNQLLWRAWSVGARYRLTDAHLNHRFPNVPRAFNTSTEEATLQQVNAYLICNLPSGLFAQGDAIWSQQNNRGYTPAERGDNFWQFNAFAGYRFPTRHAELRVGVLNISDRDYKLNPLTLYNELPRERTLYVAGKINF